MPCYAPIRMWYSLDGVNPATGRWKLTPSYSKAYHDIPPIYVPCGKCIGCRLERSRMWAMRCVHEASLYENNCFITLTFNDFNLDKNLSLRKDDWVLFMKRLRARFGDGIRFFHCGEYGSENQRPHHHAILFNFDFDDKEPFSRFNGNWVYTSETLSDLWHNKGFCTVGNVTFESCAYVARYVMKKVTGEPAKAHYGKRLPEYCTMSRRPGIGSDWFNMYKDDLYNYDLCVVRGNKLCKVPRFYDNMLEKVDKSLYSRIKLKRRYDAWAHCQSVTNSTLRVPEPDYSELHEIAEVKKVVIDQQLKRKI